MPWVGDADKGVLQVEVAWGIAATGGTGPSLDDGGFAQWKNIISHLVCAFPGTGSGLGDPRTRSRVQPACLEGFTVDGRTVGACTPPCGCWALQLPASVPFRSCPRGASVHLPRRGPGPGPWEAFPGAPRFISPYMGYGKGGGVWQTGSATYELGDSRQDAFSFSICRMEAVVLISWA